MALTPVFYHRSYLDLINYLFLHKLLEPTGYNFCCVVHSEEHRDWLPWGENKNAQINPEQSHT